jgi:surface protein
MFKISSTLGNDCSMNWLDVSGVTSMRGLFASMQFNGDISRWDVSNVEDMTSMFEDSKFNGNISGWDVSSVRYMSKIFDKCPFCQDISSWNCASMKPELLKDALRYSNIPKRFKPKAI